MDDPAAVSARRSWGRIAAFVVPAVILLVILAVAVARTNPPPQPGDPAPAFEAPLLDGEGTLALSDLRGKPVVLNFWASWCAPCVQEAPVLEQAYERYGDEVAFVGVNIRDARSGALAFSARYGAGYPDVRDEGRRIEGAYGLTGQPETFFIDADGSIAEHVAGPIVDEDVMMRLVGAIARRG